MRSQEIWPQPKETGMPQCRVRPVVASLGVGLMLATSATMAQESADTLAKQLSNPVASLISVPLQYNVDFDIGPENGTKHYLNVQPVIPTSLNEDVNLI